MGEMTHIPRAESNNSLSEGDVGSARDYKVRSSRLLKITNWWHVLTIYLPSIQVFLLLLFIAQVAFDAKHNHHNVKQQVEVRAICGKGPLYTADDGS